MTRKVDQLGRGHKPSDRCRMLSNKRPLIIPVFLPHGGCPNRCVFCNQKLITSVQSNIPSTESLLRQINAFLTYVPRERKIAQVAFYGGNFLGLPKKDMERLLQESHKFVADGTIGSIRFSTRPDTINEEQLNILKKYQVVTIELGVQSMDDQVLMVARRGHTASDTVNAAYLLKKHHYEIGMQMMVGLPGDNESGAFETARRIADLSPDFVRIYPTVVLSGSLLAKWYSKATYTPISLEAAVTLVKELYLYFTSRHIRVIRMGLHASEDFDDGTTILGGPYHPAFGHLVLSEIFLDMAVSGLKAKKAFGHSICINVHPRNVSRVRGLKNRNLDVLKRKFNLNAVHVTPDHRLNETQLIIDSNP